MKWAQIPIFISILFTILMVLVLWFSWTVQKPKEHHQDQAQQLSVTETTQELIEEEVVETQKPAYSQDDQQRSADQNREETQGFTHFQSTLSQVMSEYGFTETEARNLAEKIRVSVPNSDPERDPMDGTNRLLATIRQEFPDAPEARVQKIHDIVQKAFLRAFPPPN